MASGRNGAIDLDVTQFEKAIRCGVLGRIQKNQTVFTADMQGYFLLLAIQHRQMQIFEELRSEQKFDASLVVAWLSNDEKWHLIKRLRPSGNGIVPAERMLLNTTKKRQQDAYKHPKIMKLRPF
jgi:hypothetical protein